MSESPQVFPRSGFDGWDHRADPVEGMSLRAYIATSAMQGILANPNFNPLNFGDKMIVELSLFFADGLLHQLEGRPDA